MSRFLLKYPRELLVLTEVASSDCYDDIQINQFWVFPWLHTSPVTRIQMFDEYQIARLCNVSSQGVTRILIRLQSSTIVWKS